MQTSKLFLVVCAFTLLAGATHLRADETDAQKRAREVLRQKMQELEAQPQPAVPTVPVVPAAPVTPAVPEPPAVAPPQEIAPATPPPDAPIAAPRAPDTEAQARARQALHQLLYGTQAPQPSAPVTVAVPSIPETAPVETWNPLAADNAAQARARETLWQEMRRLDAQQGGVSPYAGLKEPGSAPVAFKPVDVPPPPFSGAKAERLGELLRRYRADQITPEEYHRQRTAILAEP